YEHTSIQDILDQLGGLSKGAIYHHFKSKEDILVAVADKMMSESNRRLAEIMNRIDLNGKEKLKTIFKASLNRRVQEEMFTVAPDMRSNPKLLFSFLQETLEEAAPHYVLPIIRQGIEDGSIETDYPEELAELIMLVANVWTNPMIFHCSAEESYRKFIVFGQMLRGLGVDIIDREMSERVRELSSIYQQNM
ncbi:MAG: TetR/AcrR family transcriptional regulator, partial [Lachnospiraceae bacterium]|nr:TetR/AcrR family transcriptional regulator [Lachnospiraceae bacterium]